MTQETAAALLTPVPSSREPCVPGEDPATSRRCSTGWRGATTSPTRCSPGAGSVLATGHPGGAATQPGDTVLDLAAGTAVSTVELAKSGAWCVAADFSVGMLHAVRTGGAQVAADATRLLFADSTFDAVTISFGLRNVVDHVAGLREMARVTRSGGRLVVCEFSTPDRAGVPRPSTRSTSCGRYREWL